MSKLTRRHLLASLPVAAAATTLGLPSLVRAAAPSELRIDWATYNPVSLVLRDKGWLEEEFAAEGIPVTWVQSAGSNKALEFLSASAIDFGSTAGSAALVSKINGNPIKSIYSYSKPEWTALLTRPETGITKVEDLKGKTVAVTRGTDPHIFLIRALADVGLGDADINTVLLQHADGKTALARGDVDAWAGLDPLMASAELEDGAEIFYRNASANTFGILNTREEFAAAYPEIVGRVLSVYEKARTHVLANHDELKATFINVTGLPANVVDRQLDERTDLTVSRIGAAQEEAILAAGLALQEAGVVEASVDVPGTVAALLEDRLPASFG